MAPADDARGSLPRFLDPAVMVSVMLGLLFVIGHAYSNAYFSKLRLPDIGAEQSTAVTALRGLVVITTLVGMSAGAMAQTMGLTRRRILADLPTGLVLLAGASLSLELVYLGTAIGIQLASARFAIVGIICVTSIGVVVGWSVSKKASHQSLLLDGRWVIAAISISIVFLSFANLIGASDAGAFLDHATDHDVNLTLLPSAAMNTSSYQHIAYVTHSNGVAYFLGFKDGVGFSPFAIPESEISSIQFK